MRDIALGSAQAVVSAVLFGLAFPPLRWTPLSWLALAPLFVALRGGGPSRALLLTWLWCLVAAYAVGDWFPKAVAEYFEQPMVVAIALFGAVFTVMAGPYYAAFALAYRALARRFSRALPFLAAAAWAGAELGRGRLFTGTPFFIGNPWGLLGYAQAPHLSLVQGASLAGVYGLSFAVACVNAALADLWLAREDPAARRRALRTLALACLPAAGLWLHGAWVLARAAPDALPGEPVPVSVAQGNLDVGSRWSPELYGENLEVYLRLTAGAGAADAPRIVFWPEAAMTFFLEAEPRYRREIARVLGAHDLELVAGGPRAAGDPEAPTFTNSIWVLDRDASVRDRYDKQYLVPFAEYFPFGVDVLDREFGRIRSFRHGERVAPVTTRAGPAGVLVCNESMLPEVAGARVADGAVYLLNPSNDSWIDEPRFTEEQLDMAVFRAVEQRRYLVRASTAGPSAILDPWGRSLARSRGASRSVISAEIRPITGRSVYGRVGDLFAAACVAAVLLAIALRRPRPAGAAAR